MKGQKKVEFEVKEISQGNRKVFLNISNVCRGDTKFMIKPTAILARSRSN